MLGEDPLEAARLTRHSLRLDPDEPVPHLLNILEHHGLVILTLRALSKREAFSLWAGGLPIMAISDGRPGDQLRLNCAHELGHLVMHSRKLVFKVDDSEAEKFGAEFLMPAKAMRRELKPPITLTILAETKKRWKVPIRALIHRCKDLHIITERQHRYLFEQMSLNGWKDCEPVQLRPERARGLRQFAEVLYRNPIDYEQLAAELSLTPEMVRVIIDRYAPHKRGAKPGEEQDLPMRMRMMKPQSSRKRLP